MSRFFRDEDDSIILPLFSHNKVLHYGSGASKNGFAGKKSAAFRITRLQ